MSNPKRHLDALVGKIENRERKIRDGSDCCDHRSIDRTVPHGQTRTPSRSVR
jgi:hypothetical protein